MLTFDLNVWPWPLKEVMDLLRDTPTQNGEHFYQVIWKYNNDLRSYSPDKVVRIHTYTRTYSQTLIQSCKLWRLCLSQFFLLYLNLLSTSKLWHMWCFKNLKIILVFAITFLTILFHSEATTCTFFVPCVYFTCWLFCIEFFSLPEG